MPAGHIARTWCRVDLAGGTLDIWPLGLLHPGALTVNVAVDLAATVAATPRTAGWRIRTPDLDRTVERLDDLAGDPRTALIGAVAIVSELPPATLDLVTESPPGAGLGGSSALACALVQAALALRGVVASPAAVVALVRDVEAALMGLPTGCQDQWAAVSGGALAIEHRPGGETVRRLGVDGETLAEHLVIVYTGQSHISARQNWEVVRRRLDADADSAARFATIAEVARQVVDPLERGDLARVGELLSREWEARRGLGPGLSTAAIEATLAAGRTVGGWGGKPCGAAGGGCVALLGPRGLRERLVGVLPEGCSILPARPAPPTPAGSLDLP